MELREEDDDDDDDEEDDEEDDDEDDDDDEGMEDAGELNEERCIKDIEEKWILTLRRTREADARVVMIAVVDSVVVQVGLVTVATFTVFVVVEVVVVVGEVRRAVIRLDGGD